MKLFRETPRTNGQPNAFNADKFLDAVGNDKIPEDGIVVDELTIGIE